MPFNIEDGSFTYNEGISRQPVAFIKTAQEPGTGDTYSVVQVVDFRDLNNSKFVLARLSDGEPNQQTGEIDTRATLLGEITEAGMLVGRAYGTAKYNIRKRHLTIR